MADGLADRSWIDVQKKTFTNWTNNRLKGTDRQVNDLQTDLDDGVILIKLLEALAPKKKMPGKYNTKPKFPIHKNQNLTIAFKFMKDIEKIPLVNIGPGDIIEHNLKLILGLIWSLILRYQIATAAPDDGKKKQKEQKAASAKKLLLGWINSALPKSRIRNFTTDWSDGLNLSGLVDYCEAGLIPNHASLDPNNALENITHAMALAEEKFDVPQVMHPEDLAVEKPDELSVMTYLSYFCCPGSIGQSSLLDWIQEQIPQQKVKNFTTDWPDGIALGALTDKVSGGSFPDYENMSPKNGLENCQLGMYVAENTLGIEQTVTPEQFADPYLDQLSRMSYLTRFRHAKPSSSPASQLTVAGPGISGAHVGEETNFLVRGRVPDWAKLNISVTSPDGKEVPVKHHITTTKANAYEYTPPVVGKYKVQVKLDDEDLPGSPFSVKHEVASNAENCVALGSGLEEAVVGEVAKFSVNCQDGGEGNLKVIVKASSGASVPATISGTQKDGFDVKFTPREAGPHSIDVRWGDKPIADSPFDINVTDPSKCVVSGPTDPVAGTPSSFSVDCKGAGQGKLNATITDPKGNKVPVQVKEDPKTGASYTCNFTPEEVGNHRIDLLWVDTPIPGSPVQFKAKKPADAADCKVSDLPTGRLRAGKPYSFLVHTEDAGTGKLEATSRGASAPEKCAVQEREEGVYSVNFSPSEVGPLQVDTTFGGAPIPGSPFQFTSNDPTRCHVNAAALSKGVYHQKQPIDFRVSAQFAGEGEITAKAIGPKGLEKVEVRPQGDGTYLCHYTPQEGGAQTINIFFDGEEIPNSPIKLMVEAGSDADNVIVTQPKPGRLGVFVVENPYAYKINAAGAGSAKLNASSVGGRTGLKPSVKVKDLGGDQYTVTVEAAEPDDYTVNIMWGDDHVPGSPFPFKVEDKPRADKVVVTGPEYTIGECKPVMMHVDTEEAGAGELTATCYGSKVGSIPVEVDKKDPKHFDLKFVPSELDIYYASVLWSEENVNGSPFKVNLLAPDASKCVVTGPTVPLEMFKPVELGVDATSAGNGQIKATAVGDDSEMADVKIEEDEPGKFQLSFVPPKPDYYDFAVKWGADHVPGSPFRLNLNPANASLVSIVKRPMQVVEEGQVLGIGFNTSKAGRGELTATCHGAKVGAVDTKVEPRPSEPKTLDVTFVPHEPDIYTLAVKWAGTDVRGSPFTINLMPVDISRVKTVGPSMPKGLGGPVELMVITREAGKGKVTAHVTGETVGDVETTVTESGVDTYQVSFQPPKPDMYSLEVMFSRQEITGSPFKVNTMPPDASKVKVTEPEKYEVSNPVVFSCDTSEAGNGELSATCRGDKYGAIQADVDRKDTGEFDVSFTPHYPDRYTLSILWSGEDVPNSPFSLNMLPVDVSKVKVGPLHIPEEAGTGSPAYVDLDCSEAGRGTITGEAKGDMVGSQPVETVKLGPDMYRVRFNPKQADIYNLSVLYGGKHVSGSPFFINMLPPEADRVEYVRTDAPQKASGPVSMVFNTSNAGRGQLTATAVGSTVGPVPVTVKEMDRDQYNVSFHSPKPDLYKVDVQWANAPVKNSPFTVNLVPPSYPDKVECGEPVFTVVGEPVKTLVDVSKAGQGKVTAHCSGKKYGDVPVEVISTSKDTYNVTFVPKNVDLFSLSIFFDDYQVPQSPFAISLSPIDEGPAVMFPLTALEETVNIPEGMLQGEAPPEVKPLVDEGPKVLTNYIGEAYDLTVAPEDEEQKAGQVTATAIGEKEGATDITVSKDPEGNFVVNFSPRKPDLYTIDVKLNGNPVPESPVTIRYIYPVDANKCVIFGLQDVPADPQAMDEIKFGVNATEAGDAQLSLSTEGPSAEDDPSKLVITPDEKQKAVYHVSYTPTAQGVHRVHLLWGEDTIPGSPLVFEVGDAKDLKVYPYGLPVAMDVAANCKTSQIDAYAIHEPSSERFKCKLTKVDKGQHKVTFQPKDPGIYAVHVMVKNKPVPGSPFRLRVAEPPDASMCKVEDFPEKAYVKEPISFVVDATEAGGGELTVKVTADKMESEPHFNVSEEEAKYTVNYTPSCVGEHKFFIKWSGDSIANSPLVVPVEKRKVDVKTQLMYGQNLVPVGLPLDVQLISEDGEDKVLEDVSAKVKGKESGEEELEVTPQGEGKRLMRFTPRKPDVYTMEVKVQDVNVGGSPFTITAVEKSALDPNHPHGDEQQLGDMPVGQAVNLIVPAGGETDPSGLKVDAEGPTDQQPVNVTPSNEIIGDTVAAMFTPTQEGEHLVKVADAKSGKPVGDSPYRVTAVGYHDASKCFILEEDKPLFKHPTQFRRNKPVHFRISTLDAGPGTLNITSRGPGKAEVRIFDNQDGIYACEFTPTVAGKYHIDILWNKDHIDDSPFLLHFKSKKSRVITGLNLESESFRVGVPHRFKLHCDAIGEGSLVISCKPSNAASIKQTRIAGTSTYQCEVIPEDVGNHQLMVQFNNKHILGSPFNVQFEVRGDASKCHMIGSSVEQQHEIGEDVSFLVSTEGAGKGHLTAVVENTATKETPPISVTQMDECQYKVEFNPGQGVEYLLSIKYDDQHIEGSPFKLVFAEPQDASQCRAEGEGLISCQVDKWSNFNISTENAGPGELTIQIEGDGEVSGPSITKLNDTTYDVSYLPSKVGAYTIAVQWGSNHIPGSPFAVRCYKQSDPTLLSIPNPPTDAHIGKEVSFVVKASDVKESGDLSVTAQGSEGNTVRGQVFKENDGDYKCGLLFADTGKYTVHVRWNGMHITGSPFKLRVTKPPIPERVRAYGPGLRDGFVGQEGNFTIETADAGVGTLAVRVHGPKGAFKINMRRHPDNDRTILVRYDPTHLGLYMVDITWSETHIPGSPFSIKMAEQKEGGAESEQ